MKQVILDVDTGSDDAIAIMLAMAAPSLEVLGICTVWGNKPVENTTENTLRVLEAIGADCPVYRGCPSSIIKHLQPNRRKIKTAEKPGRDRDGRPPEIHQDLIGSVPSTRRPEQTDAVHFYIDCLLRAERKVTVVLLGPQTNLALALTICPEIRKNIEEIVIMGGGKSRTNATIAAEFNIFQDPEAALIVAESGCSLSYVPLDATHQACVGPAEIRRLRELDTAAGQLAADLAQVMLRAYRIIQNAEEVPLHDALAVCSVIDPHVLRDRRFTRVDIDCGGDYADGQTLVDARAYPDKLPNAWFALGADGALFREMLFTYLSKLR